MTAYEIIQQHPEWMKNPKGTRKAIQERAKRYIDDRKGSTNFADGITKDFDALIRQRDAINDFADVTADDGAKRQAQVYAIFIKAVIVELNGRAICTAAQVEQWRERYGVKLDGLQVMRPKDKPAFKPLGFDEETATKIYNWLKDKSIIDCPEDTFIWYFGKEQDRVSEAQPDAIIWKGKKNELACFCRLCEDRLRIPDVRWNEIYKVIFGIDVTDKSYTTTLSRIQSGRDSWPRLYSEMQFLFR